jgi:toxin-antitoxin system PIN domain toxin
MIAVDTNVLVYAHREDSPNYLIANKIITQLAESTQTWAITSPSLHEFLAIVTHSKIYKPATPLSLALEQINCWLESPSLVVLHESIGYWRTFQTLVSQSKTTGAQIHDARIAALCLHHGVKELLTADRDFLKFTSLKTRNPFI